MTSSESKISTSSMTSRRRLICDVGIRCIASKEPTKGAPECCDDDCTVATSCSSLFSDASGNSIRSMMSLVSQEHHRDPHYYEDCVRNTRVSRQSRRRKVGFSTVEVRKYAVILGDCPGACYPLSLDWAHTKSRVFRIDDYDVVRTNSAAQLDVDARVERLRAMGFAKAELRALERDRKMALLKEWESIPLNDQEDNTLPPPPPVSSNRPRNLSKV